MPKLIKRTIRGRPQFNFQEFDKAKTALWNQASAAPKKTPCNPDTEDFAIKIDALAMHLGGMPLPDAARHMRITPAALYNFKSRWLRRDTALASVLANLLESSAVKSLIVFDKKAESMDASEAASAAATLTKAAVQLRTGQNTNYQPPENVALETLDRIGKVLELSHKAKQIKGKVIDV